MKILYTLATMLGPITALAHPGHISNENIHSFLHVEHIITLSAIGIIAFLAYRSRR